MTESPSNKPADPRDVAENAVALIELGEFVGILENWRRHGNPHFARASIAIAARRVVEQQHLGEREE